MRKAVVLTILYLLIFQGFSIAQSAALEKCIFCLVGKDEKDPGMISYTKFFPNNTGGLGDVEAKELILYPPGLTVTFHIDYSSYIEIVITDQQTGLNTMQSLLNNFGIQNSYDETKKTIKGFKIFSGEDTRYNPLTDKMDKAVYHCVEDSEGNILWAFWLKNDKKNLKYFRLYRSVYDTTYCKTCKPKCQFPDGFQSKWKGIERALQDDLYAYLLYSLTDITEADWIDLQLNYGFHREDNFYTNGHLWFRGENYVYYVELRNCDSTIATIEKGSWNSNRERKYLVTFPNTTLSVEVQHESRYSNNLVLALRKENYSDNGIPIDADPEKSILYYMITAGCLEGNCNDGDGKYQYSNGEYFIGSFKYGFPSTGKFYYVTGTYKWSFFNGSIQTEGDLTRDYSGPVVNEQKTKTPVTAIDFLEKGMRHLSDYGKDFLYINECIHTLHADPKSMDLIFNPFYNQMGKVRTDLRDAISAFNEALKLIDNTSSDCKELYATVQAFILAAEKSLAVVDTEVFAIFTNPSTVEEYDTYKGKIVEQMSKIGECTKKIESEAVKCNLY
jgi:hypothetical protein